MRVQRWEGSTGCHPVPFWGRVCSTREDHWLFSTDKQERRGIPRSQPASRVQGSVYSLSKGSLLSPSERCSSRNGGSVLGEAQCPHAAYFLLRERADPGGTMGGQSMKRVGRCHALGVHTGLSEEVA